MKWDAQRVVIVIAVLAAVVLLVWAVATKDETPAPPTDETPVADAQPATENDSVETNNGSPVAPDPHAPVKQPENVAERIVGPAADAVAANRARVNFQDGLLLAESEANYVEARSQLSQALLSGELDATDAARAREVLTSINKTMIFSPRIFRNDPYAYAYDVKAGDVLVRIEREQKLHVPYELLILINRLDERATIRAGQTLKLIRGPFHAVVSKTTMTMDLFLHREGLDPVFVQRLPVGLGRNDGTPTGLWRIKLGGKDRQAAWYPPPSSGLRGKIEWGEPDYAFGEKGIWIPLEGIDEITETKIGYGIHSTSDPDSIGRSESLGCIRLRDDDIERVYSTLYEKWSTVRVIDE